MKLKKGIKRNGTGTKEYKRKRIERGWKSEVRRAKQKEKGRNRERKERSVGTMRETERETERKAERGR